MRAPSRISAIPSADVALLCAIVPNFSKRRLAALGRSA
jgi:hypothetical protein